MCIRDSLERNLYLTTQLTELGIPVVVAINMMDVVKKSGDKIDTSALAPIRNFQYIPDRAVVLFQFNYFCI